MTIDVNSAAADVLLAARDYVLVPDGWQKSSFGAQTESTGAVCGAGALGRAIYVLSVFDTDADRYAVDVVANEFANRALVELNVPCSCTGSVYTRFGVSVCSRNGYRVCQHLPHYNDAETTTAQDVANLLERAAVLAKEAGH